SDLQVQLDGVAIKPALALGSWIAFQPNGHSAVVMGDLVLTTDEVTPVMSALLDGGIQVTALHNHLLRSTPAIFYMHVRGEGDAARLAASIHAALARSHTPLGAPTAAAPGNVDLNTATIDDHGTCRQAEWSGLSVHGLEGREDRGGRHGRARLDGHRNRDQLSADGRRESRGNRRFRP